MAPSCGRKVHGAEQREKRESMTATVVPNLYSLNFYTDGPFPLTIDIYPTTRSLTDGLGDERGYSAGGDILATLRFEGEGISSDFEDGWVLATVSEWGVGMGLPDGVNLSGGDMAELAALLVRLAETEGAAA